MNTAKPDDKSAPSEKSKVAAKVAAPPPEIAASSESTDVSQLTPEEQMARFEKELKENDWGHQPC